MAVGPTATQDAFGGVPLTPAELRLVAAKNQLAADEQARADAALLGNAAPLICPHIADGVQPASACMPYYGYVATHARQQANKIYCGPAAVQVVSNYAWGYTGTSNRYPQATISKSWTYTDTHGQTYPGDEATGLTKSTAGHVPSGFIYVAVRATSGADWHNKLRTDVGISAMPMVVNLAPHNRGATYWLSSWPTVADGAGHYIVLNGWDQVWDNTRYPTVTYDDGSGGYGGGTGEFRDPATDVYYTISIHSGYTIW